ncbi:hypothetical protein L873DRAFT_1193637 [Choiromyces venosus 120613-1]|uniref:Uncharacterized protein n=1 Tax=Choiromyces venosus 120613-1 TaxID=1336337 RepID=A0A3N4JER6_9PEZI|nr:hypothetical protein L873DRAFT_1193637 [Choiromyces venosus 120613-1]
MAKKNNKNFLQNLSIEKKHITNSLAHENVSSILLILLSCPRMLYHNLPDRFRTVNMNACVLVVDSKSASFEFFSLFSFFVLSMS